MNRLSLILGILVLASCLQAADQNLKNYKNQKEGYEFFYPANWELETDANSDYASLFSPGARNPSPHSLDLSHGIKMEFIREADPQAFEQELKAEGFKPCGTTNEGQRITYCTEEEDGVTIVITGMCHNKTMISARGYIPEKQKKAQYLEQYLKIIGSFSFTTE